MPEDSQPSPDVPRWLDTAWFAKLAMWVFGLGTVAVMVLGQRSFGGVLLTWALMAFAGCIAFVNLWRELKK
jgi:hypothetical protein